MVVLLKSPTVMLVALFTRGFWLEVSAGEDGRTSARYLHGERCVAKLVVGRA
ncbi:MAG: hypothetical protein U0271_06505 [Polyangiaceae bacterium]